MFKSFITLFSEADILFYIFLACSVTLFIIELFIPKVGIAGISGAIMTITTITERCTHGDNTSKQILLYMFYICVLVFVLVGLVKTIILMIRKKKYGIKFKIIDGNKVPIDKSGNPNYSFLIGKEGEAVTDLKPTGKVRFEEGTFEVTSVKEYIYNGTYIIVDKIFDGRIVVKRKGK